MSHAVRRPCSDFMDVLWHLINCRIIIIIIIILLLLLTSTASYADVLKNGYRALSKRLVPTNVDMYRMYRKRDILMQQRRSDGWDVALEATDTQSDTRTPDQIQRQLLIGGSYFRRPVYLLEIKG